MKHLMEEEIKIRELNKEKAYLCNLAAGRKKEQNIVQDEDSIQRRRENLYVYQYRNLDSFWSIIENDCFWATNARFSNDQEEQKLGTKKIRDILGNDTELSETYGDCYIVCFCDEDDKLSQWRGYAPEGVSIGFDFNNVRPYYIKAVNGENYLTVYNSCYRVVYTEENTKIEDFAKQVDIEYIHDPGIGSRVLEIIPYMKHSGFYEEAESRLVFSGESVDLSNYIHYRMIGNIKVPYLVIKAGNKQENKSDTCVVRICVSSSLGEKLKDDLSKHFKKKGQRKVRVINCIDPKMGQTDDTMCFGCTIRETYVPGINGKNKRCRYACEQEENFYIEVNEEIYLSDSKHQEEVYHELFHYIKGDRKYKDIKIWCEGFLPVRTIRVGSLHNKEIVMESIKHYCNDHYWLNYVEVSSSNTPYRSSLL